MGMGLLLLAGSIRAQETKTTVDKTTTTPAVADDTGLVGHYEIVSGEDAGKAVPEERIKGSTVRITAETIVVVDKQDKEAYVAKYALDTASKPYKITMTESGGPRGRKGEKAVGIIQAEGDTTRLAYAFEGGIVPTEFKTRSGGKQLMFVLKRKPGQ
jgi:uncharacterized protein (TIGR03067 family)